MNEYSALKNLCNHASLELDMVVPSLKSELGARLGIVRAKDGTSKARIAAINLIFDNRVGSKNEQIVATTYGRALKGSAKVINQDEDSCEMCECNKIGK